MKPCSIRARVGKNMQRLQAVPIAVMDWKSYCIEKNKLHRDPSYTATCIQANRKTTRTGGNARIATRE
jgi:hypothetical protein